MNRRTKFLTRGLVVSLVFVLPLVSGAFAQQAGSSDTPATSTAPVTVPPLDATPPQGQAPQAPQPPQKGEEVEGVPPPGWVAPAEPPKSAAPVAKTAASLPASQSQKDFSASGEVVVPSAPISNYLTKRRPFQPWIALNPTVGLGIPKGSGNINDFSEIFGLELQVGAHGYAYCNISGGAVCMVLSPFVQANYTYHRYPGIVSGSVKFGGEIWFPFGTLDPRFEDGRKMPPWIGPFAQVSIGPGFATQYEDPSGLPPFLRLDNAYWPALNGRIGVKADLSQFLPNNGKFVPVQVFFAIDFSTTPNGSAFTPVLGLVVYPFARIND